MYLSLSTHQLKDILLPPMFLCLFFIFGNYEWSFQLLCVNAKERDCWVIWEENAKFC